MATLGNSPSALEPWRHCKSMTVIDREREIEIERGRERERERERELYRVGERDGWCVNER